DLHTILAASYLGGSDLDYALAMSLDSVGNVYLAGQTRSFDFSGVGLSAADSTFAGGAEAFVAKLDADLSSRPIFDLQRLKNLVGTCKFCPPGPLRSLEVDVDNAIRQVRLGHSGVAATDLRHFVAQTTRFMDADKLPAEQGRQFVSFAEQIITELPPQSSTP